MPTTTSADGTTIAYDISGNGPPLILVVGAFNERPTAAPLADALIANFTVVNYDRRGRGASSDTTPYAVDREIDDLAVLLDLVGGQAAVFGYSSGAVLALRAAARGLAVSSLVLYDPPFPMPGHTELYWSGMARRFDELVGADRRGDAVELFQTEVVGMPPEIIAQLRSAPFRPGLEKIAHTLSYDAQVLAVPVSLVPSVTTRTLVLYGGAGAPPLRDAAELLAEQLPNGEARAVPRQTHDLVPEAVAPMMVDFLRQ